MVKLREIIEQLRKCCAVDDNPKTWDNHLPYVFMAYRATMHESTKCSPNLLMFGDENRLPIDLIYSECITVNITNECPCNYVEWVRDASKEAFSKAREHLKKSALRQKTLYDKNTFMRTFKVGDWVWVMHPSELQLKFGRGWKGPFLVVKILGDVNYVVQRKPDGRRLTLHVDHIKEYDHGDTPSPWVSTTETEN